MSVPSWSDTLDAVDNAYGDVSIGQHKRMCAALNSSSRLVGLPRVHGDSLRQLSIKDSSGAYSIELQLDPEATIMCSCADYTWSHFICKHICWLLIRVGGQLDWCLFSLGRDNGCCWTASLRRLAANLDNPVLQREALLPNRHIHVDVTVANPADDCPICYEPYSAKVSCVKCTDAALCAGESPVPCVETRTSSRTGTQRSRWISHASHAEGLQQRA